MYTRAPVARAVVAFHQLQIQKHLNAQLTERARFARYWPEISVLLPGGDRKSSILHGAGQCRGTFIRIHTGFASS